MTRKQTAQYSTIEIETLIRLWDAGKGCQEIAATMERTRSSIQDKIKHLRSLGYNLATRTPAEQGKISGEARRQTNEKKLLAEPAVALPEVTNRWPDTVRFEDDPRAYSDQIPHYIPVPSTLYRSAASSLVGGARFIGRGGKVGAVL